VAAALVYGGVAVDAKRAQKQRAPVGGNPLGPAGILVSTRFNCAFPFCPTTALDVCSLDEHYEKGRPNVIATLIEQTDTALMNFSAYSDFDFNSRYHYTLAAGALGSNTLFTTYVAPNGTSGALVKSVVVNFPADVSIDAITYLFTYKGNVYVSFSQGVLVSVSPQTGAVINEVKMLSPSSGLTDSLACSFDSQTGIFYANAQGDSGFYLHSYNVATSTVGPTLGPLPYTPGTSPGPGKVRPDNALASMVVYKPAAAGGGMELMELRNSPESPFLFMAWLNPVNGTSTLIPLPDDWYQDWEIDPQIFPTQWTGSTRRVWSYDYINNYAWFKMYDECGGDSDDCDEDETVLALAWVPPVYVDWYVAVEPVEPELTQFIWTNTSVPHVATTNAVAQE